MDRKYWYFRHKSYTYLDANCSFIIRTLCAQKEYRAKSVAISRRALKSRNLPAYTSSEDRQNHYFETMEKIWFLA